MLYYSFIVYMKLNGYRNQQSCEHLSESEEICLLPDDMWTECKFIIAIHLLMLTLISSDHRLTTVASIINTLNYIIVLNYEAKCQEKAATLFSQFKHYITLFSYTYRQQILRVFGTVQLQTANICFIQQKCHRRKSCVILLIISLVIKNFNQRKEL